jgi:type I restriction enzyme S subunit
VRLRYVARLNPPVPGLAREDAGIEVSFLPLDRIWEDDRFDPSGTIEFNGDVQSYNPVAEGDVLLPKVSPTFAHGRVAIARGLANSRGLATSEVFVIRARDADGARFLRYRLRATDFRLEGQASWTGVAGLKRVSADFVRDTAIDEAAWGRRAVVADFLDRECDRIRRLDDAIERAGRRAAANHWEAAYGRLVEPEGGKSSRLVDLTGPVVAGAWGDEAGSAGGDALCYRVADFDRLTISTRPGKTERSVTPDALRRLALAPGDLLMEKSGGGTNSPVGFVVRYAQDDAQAICSNFIGRIRPDGRADPLYLVHVFGALYGMRRNEPYVKQVTGIQNLDVHGYLRLRVPYQDLAAQRLIGSEEEQRLAAVIRSREEFDQLRASLLEYRDALITEAVTGKLDVARLSEQQMDESAHAAMEGERPEVLSA